MQKYLCFLTVFFFIMAACTPKVTKTQKTGYRIQVINNETPKKIISDTLVYNLNSFAFTLFKNLQAGTRNTFVSPYSISTALGLAYFGAGGNTAAQFTSVMGWNPDKEKFGEKISQLNGKIFSDSLSQTGFLSMANALWIEKNMNVRTEYLSANKKYLDAGIYFEDFKNNPGICTDTINNWVAFHTKNKIVNFIQPGIITNSTRMVLTNAIYFYAKWKNEFAKKNTENQEFHISPVKVVTVPFMNDYSGNYLFYEDENIKALELPYTGERFSAVFILPQGNGNYLKAWDYVQVDSFFGLLAEMRNTRVDISIPKFKINSAFNLPEVLSRIGFTEAFSMNADFSGISETTHLYFDQVIHKSFIEVNEAGTEAAAATGIFMRETALPGKEIKAFIADHPFIFLIRENSTNTVIFIGQLFNPLE